MKLDSLRVAWLAGQVEPIGHDTLGRRALKRAMRKNLLLKHLKADREGRKTVSVLAGEGAGVEGELEVEVPVLSVTTLSVTTLSVAEMSGRDVEEFYGLPSGEAFILSPGVFAFFSHLATRNHPTSREEAEA